MTVVAPPRVEFMTDAVAHWAAVQPDAEALTYGEVQWTWAQWHDRIRRVAGGLAGLGIGRGGRVAFLYKNNPACLEVSLGAGLLGADESVPGVREAVQATLDLARGLGLADTLTDDSRRRDRIIAQWAVMLDTALAH